MKQSVWQGEDSHFVVISELMLCNCINRYAKRGRRLMSKRSHLISCTLNGLSEGSEYRTDIHSNLTIHCGLDMEVHPMLSISCPWYHRSDMVLRHRDSVVLNR